MASRVSKSIVLAVLRPPGPVNVSKAIALAVVAPAGDVRVSKAIALAVVIRVNARRPLVFVST